MRSWCGASLLYDEHAGTFVKREYVAFNILSRCKQVREFFGSRWPDENVPGQRQVCVARLTSVQSKIE